VARQVTEWAAQYLGGAEPTEVGGEPVVGESDR